MKVKENVCVKPNKPDCFDDEKVLQVQVDKNLSDKKGKRRQKNKAVCGVSESETECEKHSILRCNYIRPDRYDGLLRYALFATVCNVCYVEGSVCKCC